MDDVGVPTLVHTCPCCGLLPSIGLSGKKDERGMKTFMVPHRIVLYCIFQNSCTFGLTPAMFKSVKFTTVLPASPHHHLKIRKLRLHC